MVHALHEIWRVLAGNGTLGDLRPLSCQCPIELVTPSGVVHVGEADATGMAADDDASDRAIQFHGAMGFTYECDAQLYIRRAQWSQQQFGDSYYHRKRLATLLLG